MGSNGIQKILALLDGTDDEVYVGLLLSTKLLSSLAVMNEKVAFLEEIYARLKSNNFVARLFSTLSVPNDEQNETDLRAFSLSLLASFTLSKKIVNDKSVLSLFNIVFNFATTYFFLFLPSFFLSFFLSFFISVCISYKSFSTLPLIIVLK